MRMKVQSLELEADSYLAFTAGQVLLNGAYSRLLTHCLKDVTVLGTERVLVRRRVRTGGLEHLRLDAFSEIESLGEAHIQIDERGRGLRIASVQCPLTVEVEARPVEQAISVEVGPAAQEDYAAMEAALGTEDHRELHFPRPVPN